MRLPALALFALFATMASARADVISRHPDGATVTFYHDEAIATSLLLNSENNPWVRDAGFAFITETRSVDLPAGPVVIKFEDVTSTMVPQTADIQGLPSGALERNFDYNLLSPGSLLAKSIGETVRVVHTNPKTGKPVEETAIVRAGANGAVLEINGKFEALHCSGLPEKLVFEHVPGGLIAAPTLSVHAVVPAAGHYTLKLSYIATGLNWSADYVAHLSPDGSSLTLNGWLTLANFSSTSFRDAPVDVVAGHLQTTGSDKPIHAEPLLLATRCWATQPLPPPPPPPPPPAPAQGRAGAAEIQEVVVTAEKRIAAQTLGDYKLYPLPEPTNVAAQQTKQVQFLYQENVPFERIYRFDMDGESLEETRPADVVFRLKNETKSGLGLPLPAGSVSVVEPGPDGSSVFAGQNSIGDTAVGLPVEVKSGRAIEVRAQPRLVESETDGKGDHKRVTETWEVAIENAKAAPVAFELRQWVDEGSTEIASESHAHVMQYGCAVWRLRLTPGEREIVRYAIVRHDM